MAFVMVGLRLLSVLCVIICNRRFHLTAKILLYVRGAKILYFSNGLLFLTGHRGRSFVVRKMAVPEAERQLEILVG